jgi:DNA-binding transcriptional LysR family regulator
MDFRIHQLRCFLVLSETLNYGRAAKMLFITQPTLSFQIKSLEEDFGVKLFDRNHQGVRLTDAGRSLVLSSRKILAEVQNVHLKIQGIEARTPLRVCCSQAGQFEILPKMLQKLHDIDPEFQVDFYPMVPEERVQSLLSGKLDVLMMVAPVQANGVTFQYLSSDSAVAGLPNLPQYRNLKSISIHELAKLPLIVSNERDCRHCKQFAISRLEAFGYVPQTVESSVNINVQLALVAANKGFVFASEAMVGMPFTGVVFVAIQEPIPKSRLGVAWRTTDRSKPLHLFLKTLVQVVQASTSHMEYLRMPAAAMNGQPNQI